MEFIVQQPFVTSTIIGATNLEQLQDNINNIQIELTPAILQAIEGVQNCIPDPAP